MDQLLGLPFASRRPGAVCMFHIGRCGSSVLGEMLDQHPAVKWDREIYYHRWVQERGADTGGWDSETFLRRRMWCAGSRWYGYEIKFLAQQHLAIVGRPLGEYVDQIARAGVTHNIVLRRRNVLRRLISAVAGARSGRRHARPDEPDVGTERVRLRVDALRIWNERPGRPLLTCLDDVERSYAELATALAGQRVLHLTFEDDIEAQGPERAYRRVCEFLALSPQPVSPHTRRLHAKRIEDLLENYDEVAAALRGTPHEWMLD